MFLLLSDDLCTNTDARDASNLVYSFAILSGDRNHQEGFDCIDSETPSKLLGSFVTMVRVFHI